MEDRCLYKEQLSLLTNNYSYNYNYNPYGSGKLSSISDFDHRRWAELGLVLVFLSLVAFDSKLIVQSSSDSGVTSTYGRRDDGIHVFRCLIYL